MFHSSEYFPQPQISFLFYFETCRNTSCIIDKTDFTRANAKQLLEKSNFAINSYMNSQLLLEVCFILIKFLVKRFMWMMVVYSVLNHVAATGPEYHESGVQWLGLGTPWEKWGWKEVMDLRDVLGVKFKRLMN